MTQQAHDGDGDRHVSLLALDQYMREVRWTPALSEEEEAQLLQRVERGKCERLQVCPNQWRLQLAQHARNRLVEAYQPLVIHIVKGYASCFRSLEFLDLVQEGTIGLMHAIEHNDLSKGFPLRKLAGCCIRQALWKAFYERDSTLRVSRRVLETLSRMRRVERELAGALGREPSFEEITREMQMSEEKLREYIAFSEREEVLSLQTLLDEEDAEDRLDFVSLFAASVVADQARQASLEQLVQQAIDTVLPQQQREVIRLRYGLGEQGNPQSFRQVADQLEAPPQSVYRSEQRAKERLRQVLASCYVVAQEELSI